MAPPLRNYLAQFIIIIYDTKRNVHSPLNVNFVCCVVNINVYALEKKIIRFSTFFYLIGVLFGTPGLRGSLKEEFSFLLPVEESERALYVFDKIKQTPKKYPRKPGVPNKTPIK